MGAQQPTRLAHAGEQNLKVLSSYISIATQDPQAANCVLADLPPRHNVHDHRDISSHLREELPHLGRERQACTSHQ